MIQTVLKRDGRIVGFNEEKIVTAIRKAMLHTDKGEDMQLIRQITDHISFKGDAQMTVEAIQDLVEMELMKSSRKDVAQKYIAYRNQRSIARKAKTRDMFLEIINIKSNDITRENANMNADTPAGMMMKFASETTKPFVDDYLLSEEVLDAVSQNYLHIHDKDYYPTKSLTCVQHPLDRILTYGFSAGHGESHTHLRLGWVTRRRLQLFAYAALAVNQSQQLLLEADIRFRAHQYLQMLAIVGNVLADALNNMLDAGRIWLGE